tara:strand:+ start:27 stop:281 length:255 start_codon:yes stop_codon:yes gene_type:complete
MADAIKFTDDEVKSIRDLQDQYNKAIFGLGQITFQMDSLTKQKESIHNLLGEIKEKEDTLAKSLNEKYGAGSLDLETGTFTPQR